VIVHSASGHKRGLCKGPSFRALRRALEIGRPSRPSKVTVHSAVQVAAKGADARARTVEDPVVVFNLRQTQRVAGLSNVQARLRKGSGHGQTQSKRGLQRTKPANASIRGSEKANRDLVASRWPLYGPLSHRWPSRIPFTGPSTPSWWIHKRRLSPHRFHLLRRDPSLVAEEAEQRSDSAVCDHRSANFFPAVQRLGVLNTLLRSFQRTPAAPIRPRGRPASKDSVASWSSLFWVEGCSMLGTKVRVRASVRVILSHQTQRLHRRGSIRRFLGAAAASAAALPRLELFAVTRISLWHCQRSRDTFPATRSPSRPGPSDQSPVRRSLARLLEEAPIRRGPSAGVPLASVPESTSPCKGPRAKVPVAKGLWQRAL